MFAPSLALLALLVTSACGPSPSTSSPSTTAPVTSDGTISLRPAAGQAIPGPDGGAAPEVTVGKPPPDFEALSHDGEYLRLSALKGKPVVLYFYPRDETPTCTKEACSFRDAWKNLSKTGAVLIGISTDDLDAHRKFAAHYQLPFQLVSDANGSIAAAYGVPNRGGFLARQTFVIGSDGNVKNIYRTVDVTNHATEVLADLSS
ncbi:Thiol peroxidase, Bcp-type [Labilithrix luteola]|uniref:thioredoxin-dependent peroxiredoxin n=1 Tax=Labilithrix luteola TaxID=1391654 RepID=A0A0K1PLR4_9BACT|nr:Thiol peroxidase, Bcp-type [Labilithrix luteola]